MKKHLVHDLKDFAYKVQERYSKKNRARNFNNETFEVDEIIHM